METFSVNGQSPGASQDVMRQWVVDFLPEYHFDKERISQRTLRPGMTRYWPLLPANSTGVNNGPSIYTPQEGYNRYIQNVIPPIPPVPDPHPSDDDPGDDPDPPPPEPEPSDTPPDPGSSSSSSSSSSEPAPSGSSSSSSGDQFDCDVADCQGQADLGVVACSNSIYLSCAPTITYTGVTYAICGCSIRSFAGTYCFRAGAPCNPVYGSFFGDSVKCCYESFGIAPRYDEICPGVFTDSANFTSEKYCDALYSCTCTGGSGCAVEFSGFDCSAALDGDSPDHPADCGGSSTTVITCP